MRWTIPNILTVMRLMAAPGVAFAFVIFPRPAADWIAFGAVGALLLAAAVVALQLPARRPALAVA